MKPHVIALTPGNLEYLLSRYQQGEPVEIVVKCKNAPGYCEVKIQVRA